MTDDRRPLPEGETPAAALGRIAPDPAGRDISVDDLVRRFTYHRPEGQKVDDHNDIRKMFLEFAIRIRDRIPAGREKSVAYTKLEEAANWAHAAIAREGK